MADFLRFIDVNAEGFRQKQGQGNFLAPNLRGLHPSEGHPVKHVAGRTYSEKSAWYSGTKKEPKPKLLSPDIFWWDGGLPREGVGAKKFGMSLETKETKLFGQDIPGFRWDIPGVPDKFGEKKS